MKLQWVILAALCGVSGMARAQPIQGVYVGLGAGVRAPFDIKTTALSPGLGKTFEIGQRPGFDTRLGLGYAFGNGWRLELEGTYARTRIDGVSRLPYPATASGTTRTYGVMANALFDMDVGSPYIYPYLGLGAGYQATRLDGFAVNRTDTPFAFSTRDESGGFAMQAIIGSSFPIPNVPGLSVTLDYRVMDVLGGRRFDGQSSFGPSPNPPPVSGTIKLHNQFSHGGILGVRYAFNTPAPPAVASPTASAPPAQVTAYVASFEAGGSALSERGRAVVREAARTSNDGQATRIALGNAADGSFSNPLLAEQRARGVVAALVGQGVPQDEIAVLVSGVAKAGGAARRPAPRVEVVLP